MLRIAVILFTFFLASEVRGQAAIGNFTINEIGSNGILCQNESCIIQPLNGQAMPADLSDPLTPYQPGIGIAIFSCSPVYTNNDLLSDPCFIGIYSAQNASAIYNPFIISNDVNFWNQLPAPFNQPPSSNVTLYFQVVTLYNTSSLTPYSSLSGPNFDLEASNYLTLVFQPNIQHQFTENCLNNEVILTITEGNPITNLSTFTISNPFPSSANFPSIATNGNAISIGNVMAGQTIGMQMINESGCLYNIPSYTFQGPSIAVITSPSTFCENDPPSVLSASPINGIWSGSPAVDNITGQFNPAFFDIDTPTNYTLQYTPTDAAPGCNIAANVTITVNPTIESTINDPGEFCINDPLTPFTAINPSGIWSGPFNCISPTGIFDPGIAQAGVHTIVYSMPGQCGSSSSIQVTVHSLPIIQFTASALQGCLPLEVVFENTTLNSGSDYKWFINQNQMPSFDDNYTHTFEDAFCYDIGLALTDLFGCRDTLDSLQLICPFEDPWIEFEMNPLIPTIDQPVVYFSSNNPGLVSHLWDFAGEGSGSGGITYHSFESVIPGEFQVCLTAIDTNGCENIGCDFVPLVSAFQVFAPTAFTPGNDGRNDAFKPVIVSPREVKRYELLIYDRWGNKVFFTDDPDQYWYGNFDNGSYYVADDVYTWKLKVTLFGLEDTRSFEGNVLIVR